MDAEKIERISKSVIAGLQVMSESAEWSVDRCTCSDAIKLIESLSAELSESMRRERAAIEFCQAKKHGDGDYYCGMDAACDVVLDILTQPRPTPSATGEDDSE